MELAVRQVCQEMQQETALLQELLLIVLLLLQAQVQIQTQNLPVHLVLQLGTR